MGVPEKVVEFNDHGESVTHLLRIACGLESMIGSAAVDLAEDEPGTLHGKTVTIIGAGAVRSLVAHALAHRNVSAIYVANRTFKRTGKLVYELNGFAVRYDEKDKYIARSDVVISATSAPHAVLAAEMLRQIMKNHDHDLLLIDIATPGDIEEVASDLRGQTDIRILLLMM